MKSFCIITALLCLLLPVEAAQPLKERLPAELPNHGFNNKFKWNPVEINKQQYLPLSDLQIFYKFDQLEINDKTINLINPALTIHLTTGSQTATINKVKFILSEPIHQHNGTAHISSLDLRTLIDPTLRPIHQKIPTFKTIVLDAGHGGKDAGAAMLESKHTLALTRQVRDTLKKKGYAVVLTRNKDIFVSLAQRVQIANTTPDAIFISLHFNSGNKRAHGFESFLLSARQPRPTHSASLALTTAIHSQCLIY